MACARFIAAAAATVCASLVYGCSTGSFGSKPEASAESPREPPNPNALTVVAEIALERGDCRTAAESYAVAAGRGDVALARRASEVALACEHLPAAWQAVDHWRAAAPQDTDAATIYAAVALKLHRIAQARDALVTALPQSDAEIIALLDLLTEEADAPSVLAAADELLASRQPSPMVIAALGQLALRAYDLDRAERRARQALKKDEKSAPALRLLAHARALQGDPNGAIAAARALMRLAEGTSAFEVAEVLALLDRQEEAHQELERLRGSDDVAAGEIDRRLALLAFESGDLPQAQRRFADLMSRGEATDAALFYLADIAARSGDKEAALAGYRQLIDSPLAMAARTRAASLLLERSERAAAFELLDDYAAKHPENSFELTLAKAQLLAEHGDYDSGLALLASALERHPEHPAIGYERAVMLERAGRVSESIQAFEDLLARRPEDPTLLNALGYTLADHGLQLSRAETLIRRALTSMPDSPAALDSLAWVRLRRGDARGAIPTLQRAYAIGRDAEIAAHWGEALWVSGERQEARKVWAAALARHPDAEPLKATLKRLLPPESP